MLLDLQNASFAGKSTGTGPIQRVTLDSTYFPRDIFVAIAKIQEN
jgi:hypothetical protein